MTDQVTPEYRPAGDGLPAVEIHRSARRRRSASARARGGTVVVRVPAGLDADEEERIVAGLVRKVTGQQRAAALGGDDALHRRAIELADRYVGGVRPTEVRWSGRMQVQHGSCTPSTGAIRISRALVTAPAFVRDYVLVHELAHLLIADHSAAFHALVAQFPEAERARGWLEGYEAGQLVAGAHAGAAAEPAAQSAGPGSSSPPSSSDVVR